MKAGKILGKFLKIGAVAGGIAGIVYYSKKSIDSSSELQGRYKAYYQLANQWIMNNHEQKKMGDYFKNNNIKTIAIYGMGTLGDLFYKSLKDSDVQVNYFIDKNAEVLYYGVDDIAVVTLEDIEAQDKVDAIVVTPVFDFEAISNDLEAVTSAELISLEDVVYNC